MEIIREPKLYLVGRPSLVLEGIARFFDDEDVQFSIKGQPVTLSGKKERAWDVNSDIAGEIIPVLAGKACYDSYGRGRAEVEPYLGNLIESGHGSVLEHCNWNFIMAGVSRVFSHEHVRHRAGCAISQRSQRYVKESESGQILLPIIEKNPEALAIWEAQMASAQIAYDKLVDLLSSDLKALIPDSTMRTKTVRSAARGVMPNTTETVVFWTANGRALRHYLELRGNRHADIEIRRLALALYDIMLVEAPAMFGDMKRVPAGDGLDEIVTSYHKV